MVTHLYHYLVKKLRNPLLFPNILRRRIIHGYSMLLMIILGTLVVTVSYNLYLENKFKILLIIDNFGTTVSEMRMAEKNYLLSKNKPDYDRNKAAVQKAMGVVHIYKSKLTGLLTEGEISDFEISMGEYERLMDLLFLRRSDGASRTEIDKNTHSLVMALTRKGREIEDFSQSIHFKGHDDFLSFLMTSRLIIVFSFFPVLIFGLVMGSMMAKKVVEPLKVIEGKARRIGRGDFAEIPVQKNSHTREIETLLEAFNKMSLELQKRQDQLVRSEKLTSLGTLVSGIAHELNNPLSNISTSAQILNEELDGSDIFFKKELLTKINEQTDRARDIIRSLLEFSQSKRFEMKVMSLKKVFDETLILIKNDIPSEIELIINVPEEVMIKADKSTIQQVFMNLIMNAVQSIPPLQKGRVSVNAWNNREKGSVGITIRDTGEGIPPENISEIFDPFFTTKDTGKGFGLGLYIVYTIIEQHNGTIEVKSVPSEGAIFIIHLPLDEIRYGV